MKKDTQDFLATLLWLQDSPDADDRPLKEKGIYDCSPAFVEAAERFVKGFRDFLEERGFEMDRLDYLSRSFGGSLYLSLSGAGAGFFDEHVEGDIGLGDELHQLAKLYAPGNRFEHIDICVHDDGLIDVAFLPAWRDHYRAKLFQTHKTPVDSL
jgi:hypothetical protein